jgi:beta-aspartyl-peptidase (threonine type)
MNKIAMAVHGGAGPDDEFIKENIPGYEDGLKEALTAGYKILEKGGSALDAVEASVQSLEDNYLFNSGRGSALNIRGEVEMDSSIMDGKTMKAGAVSMVKNVKNPITLAKYIMNHTNHVMLSDHGALEVAKDEKIQLEPDSYFVTNHQFDVFMEERNQKSMQELMEKRIHGTVGAVAVDKQGNVASATSTGGTTNCLYGRIGDSCIIGGGCYANNKTCAVSGTGDGEYLITGVIAHSIASAIEYTQCTLQQACDLVIHEKNKDTKGDMGVIAVNASGDIGISFNSERMHRAWMSEDSPTQVKIY